MEALIFSEKDNRKMSDIDLIEIRMEENIRFETVKDSVGQKYVMISKSKE